MTSDLELFAEKFEMPKAAIPFSNLFFEEEDLMLAGIEKEVFSGSEIKEVLGKSDMEDVEAYIRGAYERGILSIVDEELKLYRLNRFYGFLDIFCVSRKELYQSRLTRKERGILDEWYFEAYMKSMDPDPEILPSEDTILSLEEALRKVDEDERQLYQLHCDCKCLTGDCGLPTNVCLTYRNGINTSSHRGVAQPIDKEEAKELLRSADRAGLMHTWNPSGFCNCCGDCCYLFRAQKLRNSKGRWPIQNYRIEFNPEKCISCGLCVKRCHFQVFSRDEQGCIQVNQRECVGCGICASGCRRGALSLKPLREERT